MAAAILKLENKYEKIPTSQGRRGTVSQSHPSLTRRGEWQVPRPQLPPAQVAGFVAALGCGFVFDTKGAALRMNIIQIVRDHWVHILVPVGFVFGCYLDRRNDETLTAFRNKSLLFKRELRPNEEVTWK
ncbi:NADH dehydrogenase [ubiquinone] 1 beta subcomplex subunit 1 [Meles meles]|uniref:NADH dehydrogenase [ubiquinone] 1 beta subcomplex subunit 1 n=1 Tax=Meles meles TaxID=9662 RepID=UPI001E6985AC|nr:NADH dehydrogenase [ubiquinone] 1 beta subcomplex subunit 1 [Meles meles]